jgi:flagellar biosynthesis protein FliP
MINDGTIIKCRSYNMMAMPHSLIINGVTMSPTKEKIENKDVDPLGEEQWESNELSLYETLCELVRDYVMKNEIVF